MFCNTVCCIVLCIVISTQGLWCKNIKGKPYNRKGGSSKIFGGGDEDIETLPYMAHLVMNSGQKVTHCSGTIVSNKSIITAAHCLDGVETVKVRIGSTYSNSGGYEYLMTDFNIHPAYDRTTYDYDIGIVNVQEGMLLNGETTSAIGVTSVTNDPPAGEYMYISGWGPTTPDGKPSVNLQGAKVPVVNRTYCEGFYRHVNRRMFCAGKDNIKKCGEDFGGPAVGENYLLTGVASFGSCKSNSKNPTVFTRLGHMLIRSYITTKAGV